MPIRFRAFWLPVVAGFAGSLGLHAEPPADGPQEKAVEKLQLGSVMRRCKAATALVDLERQGTGSAVCVSHDGFFVTNHHVVASVGLGAEARLVLNPGLEGEQILKARIVKLDEENDLALLKTDPSPKLVSLALGTEENLFETQPVTALGYPFGRMLDSGEAQPAVSVNTGTVTALRRKEGKLAMIQVDAAVNPGNSGGPLVDSQGLVVGIIVSGLPGARLNFAIPVSRVRDFLAGPALVLRDPGLKFYEHVNVRKFEIDAYAVDPKTLAGLEAELSVSTPGGESRSFKAEWEGGRFVAEGAACLPSEVPSKPVLLVHKGRGVVQSELPLEDLSVGGRKFAWRQVDSLVREEGGEWVLSLIGGERFAGKPQRLPSVKWGGGKTTQLATAGRIEVRLEEPPLKEVEYQLQARQGEKEFAPIRGILRISSAPKSLVPNLDEVIQPIRLDRPLVIETVVPASIKVQVGPTGLLWMPQKGAAAGIEDGRGRHILINGQPWRPEQSTRRFPSEDGEASSFLPILLGGREPQFHLLWARAGADTRVDRGRVSVDVQRGQSNDTWAVTVKNNASEPTRIALAIGFDTLGEIEPIPPPRKEPVAESHWPLNDQGTLLAADLGPGKHSGRTSGPNLAPGRVGTALEIDRSTVACPDVLLVDRDKPFSCAAWVKRRPREHGSFMSRMNSGLRGFDLSYGGSLQALIISSWDGNVIRANAIEPLDSENWHHIAMSYDGSSQARGLKIYLDAAPATLEITHDSLTDTIHSDFPFAIGSREGRDHIKGLIDEVRAYDRVLTPDEIFELFDLDSSALAADSGSSLNQGLVGYWPFEGNSEEGFRDKSGQGHNGQPSRDEAHSSIVAQGPTRVANFGGVGGIECGNAGDFERTDSFSAGGWFLWEPGVEQSLVCKMFPTNPYRGYELEYLGDRLRVLIIHEWETNPKNAVSVLTGPIAESKWRHVFMTYDGSGKAAGVKIYIDGESQALEVAEDHLSRSTRVDVPFVIGSRFTSTTLRGRASHVRVIPRILTAEEIHQFAKADKPEGLP